MIPDYHIHTRLCKHATGEMEEYVQQAVERGLMEIAFADHNPLPDMFDIAHRMAFDELESYIREIERLQKTYPQINIKCGLEADFYDGFEESLYQMLRRFDFDLIILSVHFINGWPKNNWAFSYYFPDKSLKEIYADYLQAILRGINTGLFNIIGHLDLIKSPDEPVLRHNREDVLTILRAAKEKKMALELNTSGLRKDIGEIYPNLEILPLVAAEKIPITFGSDAHNPQQVGFYFHELEKKLRAFPEIQLAGFERRKIQLNQLTYSNL